MSSRLRGRVARAPGVTVVTVGDSGVGKTALIHRFTRDTFTQVLLLLLLQLLLLLLLLLMRLLLLLLLLLILHMGFA